MGQVGREGLLEIVEKRVVQTPARPARSRSASNTPEEEHSLCNGFQGHQNNW